MLTKLFGLTIDQALDSPELMGACDLGESYRPWRTFFRCIYGLPFREPEELELFRACTGRESPPTKPVSMLSMIIGRQAGKSSGAATLAIYESFFKDWRRPNRMPGSRVYVQIVAVDKTQAKGVRRYIGEAIEASPILSQFISNMTEWSIELTNNVNIEVCTNSFRSVRGRSVAVAILDECAFYRSEESSNPDVEVLHAVKAGQITFGADAKTLLLSSPSVQHGILHDHWSRFWGKDDARNLSWRAPTRVMNPSAPQEIIDEAFQSDPVYAASEYMAEWRTDDGTQFVPLEVIQACVDPGVIERPPSIKYKYAAFVDMATGSGQDDLALAIGHKEGSQIIVDAMRIVSPPCSPTEVIKEFCRLMRRYFIKECEADNYGLGFVQEDYGEGGITFKCVKDTETDPEHPKPANKSLCYLSLLYALNRKQITLLDIKKPINQIAGLVRTPVRGSNRDVIDHKRGANFHDDAANVVAGLALILSRKEPEDFVLNFIKGYGTPQALEQYKQEAQHRKLRREATYARGREL